MVEFIRANFRNVEIETKHTINIGDVFRINFDNRLSIPIVAIVKEIKDNEIIVDSIDIYNVFQSQ